MRMLLLIVERWLAIENLTVGCYDSVVLSCVDKIMQKLHYFCSTAAILYVKKKKKKGGF